MMRVYPALVSLALAAQLFFGANVAVAAPRWLSRLKEFSQCLPFFGSKGFEPKSGEAAMAQTITDTVKDLQEEFPDRASTGDLISPLPQLPGVKSITLETYDHPQFGPGRLYLSKDERTLQTVLHRVVIELIRILKGENSLSRPLELAQSAEERQLKALVTTAIKSLPPLASLTSSRPVPFISLLIDAPPLGNNLRLNIDLQGHAQMLSLSVRYPELSTDHRRLASYTIQKFAPPEALMMPFHRGVSLFAEQADDASFNPFERIQALGSALRAKAEVSGVHLNDLRKNLNRHLLLNIAQDKIAPLLLSDSAEDLLTHLKAKNVDELQTTGDLLHAIHAYSNELSPAERDHYFSVYFDQESTFFADPNQVFTSAPFLQQAEATTNDGKNITLTVFASVNFRVNGEGEIKVQSPDERCLTAPVVAIDVAADESANHLPLDQFRAKLATNDDLASVAQLIEAYLKGT